MRTKIALVFSSLLMSAGGFTAADAALIAQQGDYTPYDYYGSLILCKTRTNDNGVKQIKWAPVYRMSGDENHQATKVYMKVRADQPGGTKGSWATGKKAAVTPGEAFSKYRRAWTPWVGVKKESSLMVHLVWRRPTMESDYLVRQSLDDLPATGSADCDAV